MLSAGLEVKVALRSITRIYTYPRLSGRNLGRPSVVVEVGGELTVYTAVVVEPTRVSAAEHAAWITAVDRIVGARNPGQAKRARISAIRMAARANS